MRASKQTILILLFVTGISSGSLASISLSAGFDLLKKTRVYSDTSDVNRYTQRAFRYSSKPLDLEHMKASIDTAEMLCEKNNIEIPALLHLARAEYFFLTNDFNNASLEAATAMKLSKSQGENETLVRTLFFLGRYSLRTGYFKESIDYFNNSIALARKERLKGYIPGSYGNIADVYAAMGNIKEYNNCLQKLIEAGYKEEDTLSVIMGYYRLGTSLTGEILDFKVTDSIKNRDFKGADSLLRRSLELALKKRDTSIITLSLNNLGWNFYLEKKYDAAIKLYNNSLTYSIPGKKYFYSANAYGNLGTIYSAMEMTDLSLKYYNKSIDQAKVIGDIYNLAWVYKDMSDMYLRKKDTSDAFKSFVHYKEFNDQLLKKSNSQGLADAKIRYDADSHNKELQLLSLKISNQNLLIYGYTGLFILSLAIGILIFSRSRINAKRRMSDMNRKISEITQANLRQQMNPHFIFNTLNSIQYYMYQHDKLATNNYLTKFSSLMRKVLENSQHTSVPLRDEMDALRLYLELEKIRFKDKFDYQITIDEEIDTILYKVPTMLIQPYVENSICHGLMPGEGKGLVKIDMVLKKDYISCVIEDNGIGRQAAHEKKMKSENKHNSLGTQIVSSRLDLVNSLYGTSLQTIYTDLKNDAGEPEGTRVEIHIPIIT
jgi:tetratricopeptide (TPR) repeat protein